MSVDYRSTSNYDVGGADAVIPKPAGTVSGDLLVVSVIAHEAVAGDGANITPPGGWTNVFAASGGVEIFDDGVGGQRWFWYVGYRVAGGSEPSSYTFTVTNSNPGFRFGLEVASEMVCYQNPDATTPVVTVSSPNIAQSAGISFPSVTPGQANTRIVNCFVTTNNDLGYAVPNDETIVAADDVYSTPNATPLSVAAPGFLTNDVYTPNHQPLVDRGPDFAFGGGSSVTVDISDYPWDPATATGVLSYSGGGAWMGAVSLVLKGAAPQPTIADCTVGQITTFPHVPPPPFGTLTFHTDGSFDYDPGSEYGTDHFYYRITAPGGATDDAIVTINIGYPPAVFADVILKSETDAAATGTPTDWPVFTGDALFKAE